MEEGDFGDAKEPLPSAGFRGDPCVVSYGDTIAEDLCYDHPTQLEHCDEGLEDGVEEDSSICEDCAFGDTKEYEVEYHNAEVEDCAFNDTEEYDVDSYDADEEDYHCY